MPLTDEDTSVVHRLGKPGETSVAIPFSVRANAPKLEHLSLQPPLQEVLGLERKHIVETHTGVVKHTDPDESADQSVALEQTFGLFVVELKEFSSGSTDL